MFRCCMFESRLNFCFVACIQQHKRTPHIQKKRIPSQAWVTNHCSVPFYPSHSFHITSYPSLYILLLGSWMTTCLGKSCSLGLLWVPFVNYCQYVFSYFPFGFEGRMWDLIVSVPDHCLSFYSILPYRIVSYLQLAKWSRSKTTLLTRKNRPIPKIRPKWPRPKRPSQTLDRNDPGQNDPAGSTQGQNG